MNIQDSALIAAATLSHRYIADRFLPDKAIDLVDEAASKIRMEIDSVPTEIDEVNRRVMQLEIERTSLRKEKDAASKERRESIERELVDLKARAENFAVSVRQRSTSTASTSRRMPPWSAAFSRSPLESRPSRTRSRFCAA